jgi:hypothetical protein
VGSAADSVVVAWEDSVAVRTRRRSTAICHVGDTCRGACRGFDYAFDPRTSFQVAGAGATVGTFFRFKLEHAVTLAHQNSALLPIVDAAVKIERTDVYNEASQPMHPLAAIELTNSTKSQLMSGPLTLFDGGEYAGDAELPNLAPGGKRLISYALDLNVEVLSQEPSQSPEKITTVSFKEGTATVTRRRQRSQTYTIKNSNAEQRKVLVEQPREDGWKLIAPAKPQETSSDVYRFAVAAKPGVSQTLNVKEEQTINESIVLVSNPQNDPFGPAANELLNASTYLLARSVENPSEKLQAALKKWEEQSMAINQTTLELKNVTDKSDGIVRDQARIRENLKAVPPDSDLQRRYLKTLDDQEGELAKQKTQAAELQSQLSDQHAKLHKFLAQLTVE